MHDIIFFIVSIMHVAIGSNGVSSLAILDRFEKMEAIVHPRVGHFELQSHLLVTSHSPFAIQMFVESHFDVVNSY